MTNLVPRKESEATLRRAREIIYLPAPGLCATGSTCGPAISGTENFLVARIDKPVEIGL